MSRTKKNPLAGSDLARVIPVLRSRWPAAEVVNGHVFPDGGGAVVQFHDSTKQWGGHGTICIRWDAGVPMFSGHYFDEGFAADVDFLYRSRRGY